jgi:hypothetical protein
MARTKGIDAILAEAEQIKRVFVENKDFKVGDITEAKLETDIAALRAASTKTEGLRTQLTAAVNDANTQAEGLSDSVVRARAGIGAAFGLNSTQYEQAGGTRKDERKSRKKSEPKKA